MLMPRRKPPFLFEQFCPFPLSPFYLSTTPVSRNPLKLTEAQRVALTASLIFPGSSSSLFKAYYRD